MHIPPNVPCDLKVHVHKMVHLACFAVARAEPLSAIFAFHKPTYGEQPPRRLSQVIFILKHGVAVQAETSHQLRHPTRYGSGRRRRGSS